MLSTNIRILSVELPSLKQQVLSLDAEIKDCKEKLSIYSSPPFLISSVQELLFSPSSTSSSSSNSSNKENKEKEEEKICGIVIKTSTRNTVYVPVQGMVNFSSLKPGDLIGVNKDTYIPLTVLPPEYDLTAKFTKISFNSQKTHSTSSTDNTSSSDNNNNSIKKEEKNRLEDFSEVGGINNQIEELREAIALPILYPDRLRKLGVSPSKGCLLHGPPGTGKTLLARALAQELKATFFKVAAPLLAQGFVGSGAALVREIFAMASSEENKPSIIFIDEIDAIGGKRGGGDDGGSREITRTLLELLNCMDGFSKEDGVKIIAATNRADMLDPALMRSGRLDRKIEFKLPDRNDREEILEIHLRGMKVDDEDVQIKEIASMCEGFNGAMLRAVCTEAGMCAIRKGKKKIGQNELVEGVNEVKEKKIKRFAYFA